MVCPEQMRLFDLYLQPTSTYYNAAQPLRDRTGQQFDDALNAARNAQLACDKAYRKLEQHRREHGCWDG